MLTADAYVLALGCQSPFLTRPLGVDLPIYPIKGYSLTIPIGNHRAPPAMAVIDERNLVAVSRFGDRIRVTATAEFAGYDTSHRPTDFAHMTGVARELYPDGADYARAEMWAGLRPMTRTICRSSVASGIEICGTIPGTAISAGPCRMARLGWWRTIGARPTAIPVEGLA